MLQSSICFEQYYAHHQEVKLYIYTASGTVTLYERPYFALVKRELETCTGLQYYMNKGICALNWQSTQS